MMKRHAICGLISALVLLCGEGAGVADVVKIKAVVTEEKGKKITKEGKTHRGKVVESSPTEIVIRLQNGISQSVPVNEIALIRYDAEPEGLSSARGLMSSGKYSEAQKKLLNINLNSIDRPLVKEEVEYLTGFCAAKLAIGGVGTPSGAGKLMHGFVKTYPQSHHAFEANELIGDLLVAAGKPADALGFYKKAEAPWPESKQRLGLARARSMAAQKNFEQAITEYQKVLDSGVQGPEVERYRLEAILGKAAALAADGRGDAGVNAVKDVIKSAERGDTEIHARAYNALGDCYRTMNQPKEAILQYLHTDTLYFQHPDLHAESLARITQLWEKMEKPERAARARKTLSSRYPNSRWTKNR